VTLHDQQAGIRRRLPSSAQSSAVGTNLGPIPIAKLSPAPPTGVGCRGGCGCLQPLLPIGIVVEVERLGPDKTNSRWAPGAGEVEHAGRTDASGGLRGQLSAAPRRGWRTSSCGRMGSPTARAAWAGEKGRRTATREGNTSAHKTESSALRLQGIAAAGPSRFRQLVESPFSINYPEVRRHHAPWFVKGP